MACCRSFYLDGFYWTFFSSLPTGFDQILRHFFHLGDGFIVLQFKDFRACLCAELASNTRFFIHSYPHRIIPHSVVTDKSMKPLPVLCPTPTWDGASRLPPDQASPLMV